MPFALPAWVRLSSPVSLVPLRQTVQGDCDHGLHWSIQNLHILAGIFSLDILFLEGKSPLLMRNNQLTLGTSCLKLAKAVHSGI